MATVKREMERAQNLAGGVAIDLRIVLGDTRAMLDEFEDYVNSWDTEVQKIKDGDSDPRAMTEEYVVNRALEMLDEILHMPTGGTRHMHYRQARKRLLMLLAGCRDAV